MGVSDHGQGVSTMITNKEKRAAVVAALFDPENQRYSNRIILGQMCGVDPKIVVNIRRNLGLHQDA